MIQQAPGRVNFRGIAMQQVVQASGEATLDVSTGDIVATVPDPLPDPELTELYRFTRTVGAGNDAADGRRGVHTSRALPISSSCIMAA